MLIKHDDPRTLAKRAFFLAYEAAGGPQGMGMLSARANVTEEDVYANVVGNGDYTMQPEREPERKMYGDYVFGRMLKLSIEVKDDGVETPEYEPRRDYQGWAG